MATALVHIERNTTDLKNAETFYSHPVEWQMEPMPMGEDKYIRVKVGEGTGGGMMKHPVPGALSQWLPCVLVNDIRASSPGCGRTPNEHAGLVGFRPMEPGPCGQYAHAERYPESLEGDST